MNRRRVIVSPSKAPGHAPVERVLGLVLCVLVGHRAQTIPRRDSGRRDAAPSALVRIASIASGAPARTSSLARACASLEPQPTARAPAAQTALGELAAAPAPWASALSVIVSASSATAAVSPSATSRASPIAYSRSPASSRRSASAHAHHAGRAVVQQVALVDRLDEQLVLLARCRRRAGRRRRARRARRDSRLRSPPRRRSPAALGPTSVAISPPSSRSSARRRSSALSARASPVIALGRRLPLPRQAGERRGGGLERALDLLGGVRQRGKPRLELRRRRVHAAREQLAAPGGVGVEVARLRVRERATRAAR